MRIVSVDLCADHYLVPLAGAQTQILLSPYSAGALAPAGAEMFPRHNGSLEAMLGWQADLFVAADYSSTVIKAFARRHKIPVFEIPAAASSPQDISNALIELGARLGRPTPARALAAALAESFTAPAPANPPRALFLRPDGGSAARGTYVDMVLRAAGFANWADEAGKTGWEKLTPEDLALALSPPDVLITSFAHLAQASLYSGIWQHKLLRRLNLPVIEVPGRYWVCTAPALMEAVALLRAARTAQ